MEVSVEFLQDNLKQLLVYNYDMVGNAGCELWQLINELDKLKAFLKDVSIKYMRDEIYKQREREIADMLYDIEDTIDTCVTLTAAEAAKKGNHFRQLFKDSSPTGLALAVKTLRRNKVQPQLTNMDFKHFTPAEAHYTTLGEAKETRRKKARNIVGFEGEAQKFIEFMNKDSSKLEIGSIVGMTGLGKTTLTLKIFEDPKIKFEFPIRIWVTVSETPNMKNILLTILRKFTSNPSDDPVDELVIKVRKHLKDGKFFIVMDDIWTLDAWDKVKEILPRDNHKSRVLVTTRHMDVAVHSSTWYPTFLRFLTTSESWELLQYEVYGELNAVPQNLERIGKVIARHCNGLPLSLVIIGGILAGETCIAGSNALAIRKEWEKVSSSLKPYLVDGDKNKLLSSILSLSYNKMPYELRDCFLYLGVFPEDADIHVKELIWLWIAEGFILESGGKSLEQVAIANLIALIDRNLVMVKENKHDGEPKICGIHDSVRKICIMESKFENKNLYEKIISTSGGFEQHDNVDKIRRICVHSHVLEFLKKTKKVPKARSFLSFHRSPMILKPANMAYVTGGFGLLRVYNARNIKFLEFPKKFLSLIHLRYLTLILEKCSSLPDLLSELRNLQTLIVDVSSNSLDIKADIWKMTQLRHFKTKASITLRRDGTGEGGENLQTLTRLAPESCTNEIFVKAKNLTTLGIQGELNKLINYEYLEKLDRLHKLKLVNKPPNGLSAENPLRRPPDSQCFPPNLKILVVSGTYMKWENMSILSGLECLEVLKLKENAFTGSYLHSVNVFHRLEHLHIERSTELVSWKAIGHPFPKLRFLVLNNCKRLVEVPFEVCENLEMLSLERVNEYIFSELEDYKREKKATFHLKIAPRDMKPGVLNQIVD